MAKKQPPAQRIKETKHKHTWEHREEEIFTTYLDGRVFVQKIPTRTCPNCGLIKQGQAGRKQLVTELAM